MVDLADCDRPVIWYGVIVEEDDEAVDEAARRIASRKEEKKVGPGRPQEHHPADLAKALLLQKYLDAPNRTAEGLLLLFSEKLGIKTHFSYKTIERAYDDEDVKEVLVYTAAQISPIMAE